MSNVIPTQALFKFNPNPDLVAAPLEINTKSVEYLR